MARGIRYWTATSYWVQSCSREFRSARDRSPIRHKGGRHETDVLDVAAGARTWIRNHGGPGRGLADETVAGNCAGWCGQHHRHHPARGVRAALGPARPEHRRGEPYRCRGDDWIRLRRQGRSGRLHNSRPRLRTHDLASALPQPDLRPGARFCCGRPVRHRSERSGRSANQGLEDSRRSRRRGQSQAGHVELLLGRGGVSNASERGAVPGQRRGGGGARSVQGRRGGHDRGHRRTDRLLLRAGCPGRCRRFRTASSARWW